MMASSLFEKLLLLWSVTNSTLTITQAKVRLETLINQHKWPNNEKFNVYLQGSFANNTHIHGSSDIDLVLERLTPSMSDLPTSKIAAQQEFDNFAQYIAKLLAKSYLEASVTLGTNSVKVSATTEGVEIDVVPTIRYTRNISIAGEIIPANTHGITFPRRGDGYRRDWVINYPELHLNNTAEKDKRTDGNYKTLVRVYKNARNYASEKLAYFDRKVCPSYLIECLLYNAPDAAFAGTIPEIYRTVRKHLSSSAMQSIRAPNGITNVFGSAVDQFSPAQLEQFTKALRDIDPG